MGKLNPKIKLMLELRRAFIQVAERYACYADTSGTIQLTDEERRAMKFAELHAAAKVERHSTHDINLMTTRHYYAGLILKSLLRKILPKIQARVARRKRELIKRHATPVIGVSRTLLERTSEKNASSNTSYILAEELKNIDRYNQPGEVGSPSHEK